ncbi:hypothetical protein LOK49_LG04G02761 [Camellia lanceoleosa]|uniref:Uncharacterized protein n=1 Tax=Camellia lanceoleosa TaxID=1840588 RepID=A0ACC0I5H9_9ERIC|nr:hypothetical protein LOK49_LG04G02761 [Camellia lanceoleosa]
MTVETETSNHATSSEEQDHLDRSKKKVKASDANGGELLEIQDSVLEKPDEQMVEEVGVCNDSCAHGQSVTEIAKDKEPHGYGPWTIATTRRKYTQGKHKQKTHVHNSNRFASLEVDHEHGETSAAQDRKEAKGKYVDLDMGPQFVQGAISYVQTKGPIGPSNHINEGGAELVLDGVDGSNENARNGCVSPNSSQPIHPQLNSVVPNTPGNPKSLPDSTATSLHHSTIALNTATAPLSQVKTSPEKPADLPIRRKGRTNGGNGREHSHGRTQSGSMQDTDVLTTRERSVSPCWHRLVVRRGEAPDSTMVGDRFTQCEAHGASETSEENGGRPEICAQNFGAV